MLKVNLEQIVFMENIIKEVSEEKKVALIEKNRLDLELTKSRIEIETIKRDTEMKFSEYENNINILKNRIKEISDENKELYDELSDIRQALTSNNLLVNKIMNEK